MTGADQPPVASVSDLILRYGKVTALDRVTLDIPAGMMVGLMIGRLTTADPIELQQVETAADGVVVTVNRQRQRILPPYPSLPHHHCRNQYLSMLRGLLHNFETGPARKFLLSIHPSDTLPLFVLSEKI